MADDGKLEWVFSLLDKISGPSAKMAAGLKRLNQGFGEVDRGAAKAHKHTESLGLKLLEFVEITHRAYEGLHAVGEKVFGFGEQALHAIAFKQDAMTALKAVTGTAEAAHDVFEFAEKFSVGFRLDIDPVIKMATELRGAGLDLAQMETILKAGGDLGTIIGGGSEGLARMQAFSDMIRNISGKEDIMTQRVAMMAEGVGLRAADVYRELAKIMGITGEKASILMKELKEGTSTHTMPAVDAIMAMLRALQAQEHGVLGSALLSGKGNFSRQEQALANNKQQSLESILAGKGGQVLSGLMENLIKLTAPGGGLYNLIKQLVDGPLAGFLEQFTGPKGLKKIEDGIRAIKDAVAEVTAEFQKIAKYADPDVTHEAVKSLIDPSSAGNGLPHSGGGYNPMNWPSIGRDILNGGPLAPPKPGGTPKGSTGMNVEFHIDARGATPETADALRRTLQEEGSRIAGAFANILEGMQTEAGA